MQYVASLESSLTVKQMLEKSFGLWPLFTSLKLQFMLKKHKNLYKFLMFGLITFCQIFVLLSSWY